LRGKRKSDIARSDPISLETVASQMESGKGNSYNPKKGTFCLNIFSMGSWEIKIIAVE